MASYRSLVHVPPLVKRALNLAEQMAYKGPCSLEVGRLLQLLGSQHQSGVIGELSTGCGVAAAWIVSSLSTGTTFFTIEEDVSRAAAARALFDPLLNVRVIQGDWREFLRNWRFSMLYASWASARTQDPEILFQSLREGSLIVLDGLTPMGKITLDRRGDNEAGQSALRKFWLNDARLLATEIVVSTSESVILATRAG